MAATGSARQERCGKWRQRRPWRPRRAAAGRGAGAGSGGRRGNGRVPRKGDWWRHWSFRKALIAAGCTAAGFFILLLAMLGAAYMQTPIPVDASQAALQQASVVYFRDGRTVGGATGWRWS